MNWFFIAYELYIISYLFILFNLSKSSTYIHFKNINKKSWLLQKLFIQSLLSLYNIHLHSISK